MDLSAAQDKFVHEWGKLCINWGVNRAKGQIHALLLVANEDLCADQIMEKLCMSRGNVNMNLRALEDWQLLERVHKPGDRKDFFRAEKDLSKVFKIIIEERKKKELDPLLGLLQDVKQVEPRCPESSEFCRMTKSLHQFAKKADHALNAMSSSNAEWITKIFLR